MSSVIVVIQIFMLGVMVLALIQGYKQFIEIFKLFVYQIPVTPGTFKNFLFSTCTFLFGMVITGIIQIQTTGIF